MYRPDNTYELTFADGYKVQSTSQSKAESKSLWQFATAKHGSIKRIVKL